MQNNMIARYFYYQYNGRDLEDAGSFVSSEYEQFQKDELKAFKIIAKGCGIAHIQNYTFGHYFESFFIEREGKFVYIMREQPNRTHIDFDANDAFLIRTAKSQEDYTGGTNQYCNFDKLPEMINKLLS